MEEFLRRMAVSEIAGRFTAQFRTGLAAAGHHANRDTVAKNHNTSAETYGEPQTPADPR